MFEHAQTISLYFYNALNINIQQKKGYRKPLCIQTLKLFIAVFAAVDFIFNVNWTFFYFHIHLRKIFS